MNARSSRRSVALAIGLALGLSPLNAMASEVTPSIYQPPASIASDCSTDVTAGLLSWINSVPDYSTLSFDAGACYRIDGSVRIEDRWGLTFDGNGATFRAVDDGDQGRRHFWFFGGGDLTMQDLTVIGANPHGGTGDLAYRDDRAFQHAFTLQGVYGATLQRVQAYDVYGDFIYLGPDGAGHRTAVHGWSQDVNILDSTFARNGRQGIATVAARDVLIARNDFRDVRRAVFNFEPTTTTWGAERVIIEDNVTGRTRLLWLSSGGQGSNVRDIVVRRNRMETHTGVPVIHLVAPTGHRRGPITIEDNDFLVGGSPAAGFRFIRVDDVRFVNNRAVFPPQREMTAIQLHEADRVLISSNRFEGHAQTLLATDSTNVTLEEWEEPAAPPEEEEAAPPEEEEATIPSDPTPPVVDPEPEPAITLTADGGKERGLIFATMQWSGADGTVTVLADGSEVGVSTTGSFTHQTGQRGNPSITYQVCSAESCSQSVVVNSW